MYSRYLRAVLTGSLLLAWTALAEPVPQGISLGVERLQHVSFLGPTRAVTIAELAYQRRVGMEGFWRGVWLGGGARMSVPFTKSPFGLEAFVRTELQKQVGFWEPAVGIELGMSQVATLRTGHGVPAGTVIDRETARLGPLYLAFNAAPLRFHVNNFQLSALDLQVGAAGPPYGALVRLMLNLLRVEVLL